MQKWSKQFGNNNTLDPSRAGSLTLIEVYPAKGRQRNRERENPSSSSGHSASQPTVVEQPQAALKEFESDQNEYKGETDAND